VDDTWEEVMVKSRAGMVSAMAAIAVTTMFEILGTGGGVQAQPGTTIVRIRASTNATSDGIVLHRAQGVPAVGLDGRSVGTAYVTAFVAHPGLEFFPTHIEIESGAGSAVIAGLTSRDGRFQQTIGFDTFDGPMQFAAASFLDSGADYLVSYRRLPSGSLPAVTLSHAFDFTQNRVDRQIGDTGLTFRPGNVWSIVPVFGQKQKVGDNPSYSFANLTTPLRQGNVNMLRLTGTESGALIACSNRPNTCGVRGIGNYEGYYGSALSRGVGGLGLSANAASDTVLVPRDPSIAQNPPGCPAGVPLPAPRNIIIADRSYLGSNRGVEMEWSSVECAIGYVVRFEDEFGNTFDRPATKPEYVFLGGADTLRAIISIAAVAADGTVGQFSEPTLAMRLVLP
jgi:hypothetical protein